MTVDLNCDMGELEDAAIEVALMEHVTSANVACGAHAGDEAMMERTIRLAISRGVQVGAHPGYPDRANFGRIAMDMPASELEASIVAQLEALAAVVQRSGGAIRHVKPHGALYNVAAKDRAVAGTIARAVARWKGDVTLVGLAGSAMLDVWRKHGFHVAAEGFADRAYEPDGTLRPRSLPGALLTDPAEAAEQALRLAGCVDTICIHSDTPQSVAIACEVARRLRDSGVAIKACR
jgi:UPF0271 protein